MDRKNQKPEAEQQQVPQPVEHVGGINASSGGVDPDIEETLLRLSGGP